MLLSREIPEILLFRKKKKKLDGLFSFGLSSLRTTNESKQFRVDTAVKDLLLYTSFLACPLPPTLKVYLLNCFEMPNFDTAIALPRWLQKL